MSWCVSFLFCQLVICHDWLGCFQLFISSLMWLFGCFPFFGFNHYIFVDFPCQLNSVAAGLMGNEPLLDSILIHMGNMYEKLENFEMAINLYRRAISVTEMKYGELVFPDFINKFLVHVGCNRLASF